MQQFETYLKLPNDWQEEIEKANLNLGLDQPIKEIFKQIKSKVNIYPSLENIYKAFELCSYKKTKVVIFGQDPYHQNGFANGLAFAVNKGLKIPPSLKNIYREIEDDIGFCKFNSGNLENWAKQGVLLLNSSLSVIESKPGSHKDIGWNKLINSVIQLLNNKGGVIFLLWGSHSSQKEMLIDKNVNFVFKSSHPSPLSSYRGFFGCKHFSSTNKLLISRKEKPINW